MVNEAIQKNEPVIFEGLGPNSGKIWETKIFPSANGLTAIGRDITERKKAEEALKESERLYRTLFDSGEDGFMLVEPLLEKKSVIDFRFITLNQAYEQQTGAKAIDVLGKRAKEAVPELEQEYFLQIDRVVKTGKGRHFEKYNKLSARWFDTYCFSYGKNRVGLLFRDITERKNFEKAITESKEKFEKLFDQSPSVLELYDSNGYQVRVNGAWDRLYKVKRNYTLGKYNVKTSKQVIDQGWLKYIQRAYAGETVIDVPELEYDPRLDPSTKGSGRKRWLSTIIYPVKNSEGKVTNIVIAHEDITDRKKAQEALKESLQRHSELLESMEENFYEVSSDWHILYANRHARATAKLELNNLIGRNLWEVFPQYLGTIGEDNFRATMEDRKVRRFESQSPVSCIWYLVTVNPSLEGISVLGYDITERKKAEEALRTSENSYRQLFNSMTEMFFVAELLYDKKGKVDDFIYSEANPAFVESLGLTNEQVIGKRARELFGGIGIEEFWLEELSKVNKTGKAFRGEEFSRRAGKHFEVYVWKIGDNRSGVISYDVSQRKSLEKRLQDNERMAAIGQTAGMVGHDIRNPLQAVLSDTYLLKDELDSLPEGENKEAVAESIDSIERNVAYINKIVQDLQDYARQITPEYSIIDLSDVLVHVFETISVPDSIKLSINVKDAEKIRIDPSLLQRAVTNLVNNAIQAMSEGGKLEICGEKVESRIIVTISDTGVGIPDEVKSKLFTPMITTKAKGQGFGLAASKRIIEAMKGTITFESAAGKGTKFTIELPIA